MNRPETHPDILALIRRCYERARDLYLEWLQAGRQYDRDSFLSLADVEFNYLQWCKTMAREGIALS